MIRFDIQRASRSGLTALAITTAGLLAACGQGSSSTTVVLTGPPDKVDALIAQHKLLGSPVQAQMEKLPDGRERAVFNKSKGVPAGQLVDLGKAAARAGVSFEFSSGTQWGSGSAGDRPDDASTKAKGPVA